MLFPEPQAAFAFPQPLVEKYRPKRIAEFIGLEREKRILGAFALQPRPAVLLFVGDSGLGKSTMAQALALEMGADFHHVPSQKCTVENIEETVRLCWYLPHKANGFHVVLVDEANEMTDKAQLALLSKTDSTARPPQTVFIFTCNRVDGLLKPFLSRCMLLEFSNYGLRADLAAFLANVWEAETGRRGNLNWERIAKESCNNVREALNRLEVELLAARGTPTGVVHHMGPGYGDIPEVY